jgi:hypothetical protein
MATTKTTATTTTTRKEVNTDAALDKLLTALLPVLNKALVKAIVDEKCDPLAEVAKDKKALGSVNLIICTAKAEASYAVTNMTGLSSLAITSLKASVKDASGSRKVEPKPQTVTGTLDVSAKLGRNLSTKVGGKITASCGSAKESVGISGKATAKVVTGTAKANFTATLGLPESCLTKISLVKNSFRLNYKDIDVDVDKDLGIFDALLNPLIDLINKVLGDKIKGEISHALEPVLDDVLMDVLPLCVNVEK